MNNSLFGKYIYRYKSIATAVRTPDMLHVEFNHLARAISIETEGLSGYPGTLTATPMVTEMNNLREVEHEPLYDPADGGS
jgi:hypothetical protein